jgi:hypothetical protein
MKAKITSEKTGDVYYVNVQIGDQIYTASFIDSPGPAIQCLIEMVVQKELGFNQNDLVKVLSEVYDGE